MPWGLLPLGFAIPESVSVSWLRDKAQLFRQADALDLWPVAPLGISSRMTTLRGVLKSARRSPTKRRMAALVGRFAVAQDDGGGDLLAKSVVRHGEGDGLGDGWMLEQGLVDLAR